MCPLDQVLASDYFASVGVPANFVAEFADGASRDNYLQSASELSAFVDLVSLAGAGIDGKVFNLRNGNLRNVVGGP